MTTLSVRPHTTCLANLPTPGCVGWLGCAPSSRTGCWERGWQLREIQQAGGDGVQSQCQMDCRRSRLSSGWLGSLSLQSKADEACPQCTPGAQAHAGNELLCVMLRQHSASETPQVGSPWGLSRTPTPHPLATPAQQQNVCVCVWTHGSLGEGGWVFSHALAKGRTVDLLLVLQVTSSNLQVQAPSRNISVARIAPLHPLRARFERGSEFV